MTAYVELNEAELYAAGGPGVRWWLQYRAQFEPAGRIKVDGARVHVKCDDRDHAIWLMSTAERYGVPPTALRCEGVRRRAISGARFAAAPEAFFASFQPAARHAVDKPTWFTRLRAVLRRRRPIHVLKVSSR